MDIATHAKVPRNTLFRGVSFRRDICSLVVGTAPPKDAGAETNTQL